MVHRTTTLTPHAEFATRAISASLRAHPGESPGTAYWAQLALQYKDLAYARLAAGNASKDRLVGLVALAADAAHTLEWLAGVESALSERPCAAAWLVGAIAPAPNLTHWLAREGALEANIGEAARRLAVLSAHALALIEVDIEAAR